MNPECVFCVFCVCFFAPSVCLLCVFCVPSVRLLCAFCTSSVRLLCAFCASSVRLLCVFHSFPCAFHVRSMDLLHVCSMCSMRSICSICFTNARFVPRVSVRESLKQAARATSAFPSVIWIFDCLGRPNISGNPAGQCPRSAEYWSCASLRSAKFSAVTQERRMNPGLTYRPTQSA